MYCGVGLFVSRAVGYLKVPATQLKASVQSTKLQPKKSILELHRTNDSPNGQDRNPCRPERERFTLVFKHLKNVLSVDFEAAIFLSMSSTSLLFHFFYDRPWIPHAQGLPNEILF